MKKWALHFLIFSLFILLSFFSQALNNRLPGSRSIALSQATVALQGVESLFHNQAGIAHQHNLSLSLFHEPEFMLKDLTLMTAGIIVPVRTGTFGGSFYRLGTGIYSENKLALVYSKKLGKFLSAAVQFDFFSVKFPENHIPFSAVTVEGGMLAGISEHLTAGFHIFNPVTAKVKIPGGEEALPWTVRAGNAWFVNPILILCCELEKVEKEVLRVKTGMEFTPDPALSLRAGIGGGPLRFSIGAGVKMSNVLFDIAFSYHGALGFTPSAGITWIP